MKIEEGIFGEMNRELVKSYTIMNNQNIKVTCIDYGCTITRIDVPDKEGNIENIVLGFDSAEDYLHHSPYFGAVIGRVAGRVNPPSVDMEGFTYLLAENEGRTHLHGGPEGFHNVIWKSSTSESVDEASVTFTYMSADGEAGYPGNLEVSVVYTLTENNDLIITYHGISDKNTLLNLTNHTYFNLSGNLKEDILQHELTMKSDKFLELDRSLLPTGNLIDVEHTPFDFRAGKRIIEGVKSEHQQNEIVGNGYDHPFLLSENHQKEICLVNPSNGRKMIVETDEPYVVLYTGNMLEDTFLIRGIPCQKHLGLCLETQHPPNAIHNQQLPSILLEKNQEYHSKTRFTFTVE
ncbi:galactose mutarotase [Peribacillus simplex]|uniref:aldose epimerase family protein n=1 Tax=Peribacillus TaxID=2675229 RepID=UPI0019226039|nr:MULTISPECIES: aldose epimerase family protein [Peribacillus]MBD8591612.1 galactose mutarotase [Peribacillus simplex]MCP1096494.1 galactose mutarotase [Bacillaceae bacterium OS4b]MEA3576948.1 aldose epimerase family protein [Peribacillus frigoritolerans]